MEFSSEMAQYSLKNLTEYPNLAGNPLVFLYPLSFWLVNILPYTLANLHILLHNISNGLTVAGALGLLADQTIPLKFWLIERHMAMAVEKTKIPSHVSEGLWSAFPQFFARSNTRWSGTGSLSLSARRRACWSARR